ncbi:hypothetical protein DFQ10_105241 [Winogradskyella eximia]|jgi:Family of unknown function (DUF6327)|uniref:Uncharacterized protein n=1 Tax=Winogradskyella eximia TaxID=262006 RepID=A0A3D9H385_9FLAO|nr:DUF6327 family protein [Winogradskyella eximia]RED43641.1 hypothetical protein DFQ10_105241 [Winogradskyella eximia]|tara:strand:- start:402 stop:620 length:219 start_codon:yes stop_codon:yes gene_type:complete
MIPKRYNSFDEIDNDLKILSLQKQIYKERIKLNVKNSKNSLKSVNIKNELKGLIQNQLLTFVSDKVLNQLKK